MMLTDEKLSGLLLSAFPVVVAIEVVEFLAENFDILPFYDAELRNHKHHKLVLVEAGHALFFVLFFRKHVFGAFHEPLVEAPFVQLHLKNIILFQYSFSLRCHRTNVREQVADHGNAKDHMKCSEKPAPLCRDAHIAISNSSSSNYTMVDCVRVRPRQSPQDTGYSLCVRWLRWYARSSICIVYIFLLALKPHVDGCANELHNCAEYK